MPHPRAQPCKADAVAEHRLRLPMDNRGRVPLYAAANGHHIAADVRMRPELDIPQHGDCIAADRVVDVGISKYRNDAFIHGSGDPGISEYRHDGLRIAVTGSGPQHRDHGVRTLASGQIRIVADADQVISVISAPFALMRLRNAGHRTAHGQNPDQCRSRHGSSLRSTQSVRYAVAPSANSSAYSTAATAAPS